MFEDPTAAFFRQAIHPIFKALAESSNGSSNAACENDLCEDRKALQVMKRREYSTFVSDRIR